jgi:hypothetical protein
MNRKYTQAKTAKLAGWEEKDLHTFVSRYPSAPETSGSGDYRLYSLDHAIGFAAFGVLVKLGVPPRSIRNLAPAIDTSVQLGNDAEWLVIRRNPSPNCGQLVTLGEYGWMGGGEFQAIGVSDAELVQAIHEAGDGAIVLHWSDIRDGVLSRAAAMAAE